MRQRVVGGRLGEILVTMRLMGDQDVARLLSAQQKVPFIDLSNYIIDPAIAKLVPEHIARRHQMIPINKVGTRMTVAMVDPLNVLALDDVQMMTGLQVGAVVAGRADVQQALQDTYGAHSQLDRVFGDVEDLLARELGDEAMIGEPGENDAPIIRLVNLILTQAAVNGASEILLETFEREFRVRYRMDGMLRTEMTPPRGAAAAILQRIKVLASLPAETGAQARHGIIALRIANRAFNLDATILPTRHGETVSLHLRDPRAVPEDLEALGLEPAARQALADAVERRDGLVLIAGPQRSGRSSTLITLGRLLNHARRQIAVVGRSRVETHGLQDVLCFPGDEHGYAATLSGLATTRPDVVLLEDVPDATTAARLLDLLDQGVLVIARFAAVNAEAALRRLLAFPVGRALAGHLRAVSAQRLIRRMCPECRHAWTPPAGLLVRHGLAPEATVQLFRSEGCDRCQREGYRGTVGVFEVLPLSEPNRRALARGRSAARACRVAHEEGAQAFQAAALAKVTQGLTSLEQLAAIGRGIPAMAPPRAAPAPDLTGDPFEVLLETPPAAVSLALAAIDE